MVCGSKWCGWIQAVSQILVAMCFLYIAYMANIALFEISKQSREIQISMRNMETSMVDMNNELHTMNNSISTMNNQVGGLRRNMNPFRMFRP